MSQHHLTTVREHEVLWFQRRSFLQAAAAWTAGGGFAAAQAQQRSNIIELEGDVMLNGERMRTQQTVQSGDSLETGPGSRVIFVIGNSSFHLRQNTRLTVERGASLFSVSVLRLLTGAVASVWGRGTNRQIVTPTLTAGIRGTGVYTEVRPNWNDRTYFCNCYGTVELATPLDKTVSTAQYHQAFWASGTGDRVLSSAPAINHTDEELEFLARLVSQKTAWQIAGRKGVKDGNGQMY